MEGRSKHIDDLFREGLSGYREAPAAGVWLALEQRLPAPPDKAHKSSYKWLWLLLLLALMALLGYYAAKNWIATPMRHNDGAIEKIGIKPIVGNQNNEVKETKADTAALSKNTTQDNIAMKEESAGKHHHVTHQKPDRKTRPHHNGKSVNAFTAKQLAQKTTTDKTNKNETATANGKPPQPMAKLETDNAHNKTAKGKTKTKAIAKASVKNTPARSEPLNNTTETDSNNKGLDDKKPRAAENGNTGNALAGGEGKPAKTKKTKNANLQKNKPRKGQSIERENADNDMPAAMQKQKKNIAQTSFNDVNKQVGDNKGGKENLALQASETNKPKTTKPSIGTTHEPTENPKRDNQNDVAKTAGKTKSANTEITSKIAPPTGNKHKLNGKITAQNTAKKPSITKPQNSKGAPITALPETSKGKPINVAAEPNKKKEYNVEGETFKKKETAPVNGVTFKKKELAANGGSSATRKPVVEANTAAVSKKPESSKATEGISIDKYLDNIAREEAKMDAEDAAVVNPEAAASAETGKGGGGAAPSVPLRDYRESKFAGGLKVGYDMGFGSYSSKNITITPFLQWNISDKVSLWLQPGFRYNNINKTSLVDDGTYHEIIKQSRDSSHVITFDSVNNTTTIQRNYIYSNQYDSIKAGYSIKPSSFWEIELPLSVQYRIASNIAVQLGGMLSFGKIVQVEGSLQRFSGLSKLDTLSYAPVLVNGQNSYPNPPDVQNYFSYNTSSYQTIDTAQYRNPTSNPARFAIMFGFSYTFNERLMIDLFVRKNVSSMGFIPNDKVRSIYTQPYFRFLVGYKLFGGGRKEPANTAGL